MPSIYGGLAGIDLILEAGVPAIQAHVRGLVDRFVAGLDELGATVAAPPHGPLVCVRSTDAPALVDTLAAESIVASERDSSLRVSLHLYNTADDIDAVLAALQRHRQLLTLAGGSASPVAKRARCPATSRRTNDGSPRLAAIGLLWGAFLVAIGFSPRSSSSSRRRAPARDRSPAERRS